MKEQSEVTSPKDLFPLDGPGFASLIEHEEGFPG